MFISTMIKKTNGLIFGACVLALLAAPQHAHAQESVEAPPQPTSPVVDIIPASQAEANGQVYSASSHTHPPIKLTPDKSELIRLDQPAGSIIIGNPAHLSILTDTSQILVLIPRAPGATYFTILDREGNVIMQRHAIVASPKEKYIRIRNSCAGTGDDDCQATQVFYCPDMCHSIVLSGGAETETVSDDGGAGNSGPVDIESITVNATEETDE
ncbi:MAG: pilus assembly protein N-terminal domain-containing protein [Alphaproteobacteria bacterium]|nr:pilus assembly protein N-terminal domain-containing protein [Alphaproteobacteria bacterium]